MLIVRLSENMRDMWLVVYQKLGAKEIHMSVSIRIYMETVDPPTSFRCVPVRTRGNNNDDICAQYCCHHVGLKIDKV